MENITNVNFFKSYQPIEYDQWANMVKVTWGDEDYSLEEFSFYYSTFCGHTMYRVVFMYGFHEYKSFYTREEVMEYVKDKYNQYRARVQELYGDEKQATQEQLINRYAVVTGRSSDQSMSLVPTPCAQMKDKLDCIYQPQFVKEIKNVSVKKIEDVEEDLPYYPEIEQNPVKEKKSSKFNCLKILADSSSELSKVLASSIYQVYLSRKFKKINNIDNQVIVNMENEYLEGKREQIRKNINEYNKLHTEISEEAIPQIEEGAQGDEQSPTVIESANVAIETQRVACEATTTTTNDFRNLSAVTEQTDFTGLCDRWYAMDSLSWTTNKNRGDILKRWVLPSEPILKGLGKISNFTPFANFQYFSGDMHIRVELNSNKFQQGSLQLSWMYGASADRNFHKLRENVFNASQRIHSLMSAGSSNSAVIKIPYKYVNPYLACRKIDETFKHDLLDMGILSLIVLNPLMTPDETYKQANLNVFIKFENIQFAGMREFKLKLQEEAKPQMLGTIASGARLLSNVAGFTADILSKNCDKPLAPQPPTVLIPTAMNNLSYTDGVAEQYPTLRNLPMAQTPSMFDPQQLNINNIISTYGLIKTIAWTANQNTGALLFEIPAAPVFPVEYYKGLTKDDSTVYHYPPVAYVSSLFKCWRGELELRLDVISTTFHTGKLMIVYVPGGTKEEPTDYESLKSCPNMVFDLNENRQCTMQIPYISAKPWWPRYDGALDIAAPGHIRCFVMNPLVPMSSVASSVEMNLYWRGVSNNFEVAVPITPSVGLSYDATIIATDNEFAETPYSPFFTSYYYYLNSSKLTLCYSGVAGKYVQFWGLKPNKKYSLTKVRIGNKDHDCFIYSFDEADNAIQQKFMVRAKRNWTQEVAFLFTSAERADSYITTGDESFVSDYIKDGPWASYSNDGKIIPLPATTVKFKIVSEIDSGTDIEMDFYALRSRLPDLEDEEAVPQIDGDVNPATVLLPPVTKTNYGLTTFGEKIDSLKSLGRRFSSYGAYDIDPTQTTIIPITFTRSELHLDSPQSNDNQLRDGTLPIIFSAYRFVRGGLRFKLLVNRATMRAGNIIVSFDPSFKGLGRQSHSTTKQYTTNLNTIIQCTRVNEVLEFEIPYYREGQYNFLQIPNATEDDNLTQYFSLGAICVTSTIADTFRAGLLYSMADDTEVDEFIGFPPALPLAEVSKVQCAELAIPQMLDIKLDVPQPAAEVIGEKMQQAILPATEAIAKTAEMVTDNVTVATSKFSCMANVLTGKFTDMMEVITGAFTWAKDKTIEIAQILQHFIYSLISPTPGIIAFTIVNILAVIYGGITSIRDSLLSMAGLTSFFEKTCRYFMGTDDATPQMDTSVLSCTEVGVFFAKLLKLTSVSVPKIASIAYRSYCTLGKLAASTNSIVKCFSENIDMFRRVWLWLISDNLHDSTLYSCLSDTKGKKCIENFMRTVAYVTDPLHKSRLMNDKKWVIIINTLHKTGLALQVQCANEKNSRLMSHLNPFIKRINALYSEMINLRLYCPVPYEPFVVSFVGLPGVGKSSIGYRVAIQLLQGTGYTCDLVKPVFTRTPGNKHWDGCEGEPVCVYDDFLQLVSDPDDKSVSELYCLKSAADFHPPMAECEAKKITYNPLIVVLNANTAYPRTNKVTDQGSLWRRRDVLIEMKYKQKTVDSKATMLSHGEYTAAETEDVEHAEFYIYHKSDEDTSEKTKAMTFKQCFEELQTRYKKYTLIQNEVYNGRVKWMSKLWSKSMQEDDVDFNNIIQELTFSTDACIKDITMGTSNAPVPEKMANILNPFTILSRFKKDFSRSQPTLNSTKDLAFPKSDEEAKPQMLTAAIDQVIAGTSSMSSDIFSTDPKVHEDIVSEKFADICVPGINFDSITTTDALGVVMYNLEDTYDPKVLDANDIVSGSPCCLHNYKNSESSDLLYDEGEGCYILGNLMVPLGQCKYQNKDGEVLPLPGCLMKSEAFRKTYIHGITQDTLDIAKETGIDVEVPDEMTADTIYPQYATTRKAMNKYLENEYKNKVAIEISPADQSYFEQFKIRFPSVIYISNAIINKITNAVEGFKSLLYVTLVMVIKCWKTILWLGTVILAVGALWSLLSLDGGNFCKLRVMDEVITAVAEGSAAGKTYNGQNSYKVQQMRSRVKQGHFQTLSTLGKVKAPNGAIASGYDHPDYAAESEVARAELGACTLATQVLVKKVCNNMFFIVGNGPQGELKGRALGICQHRAIVPYHYVEHFTQMGEDAIFHILDSAGSQIPLQGNPFIEGQIERINTSSGEPTGLSFFEVPVTMNMFKSLDKQFLPSLLRGYPSECLFVSLTMDNLGKTYREFSNLKMEANVVQKVAQDRFSSAWQVVDGFRYRKQAPGYCGSVIICEMKAGPVIVGMHTAGLTMAGLGVAEPLLNSLVSRSIKSDEPIMQEIFKHFELLEPEEAKQQLDTNVSQRFTIPKDLVPRQANKTKMVPTKISGLVYKNVHEPAVLSSRDPRLDRDLAPNGWINPIFCGTRKRGMIPIPFEQSKLQQCIHDLSQKIRRVVKPVRSNIGKLNMMDAINGFEDIPMYDKMDLTTSEGYPYILHRPEGATDKSYLFQKNHDESKVIGVHETIGERVRTANKMRETGVVPFTIYQSCLKDEKKHKSKVSTPGKTRVFELSPVDATISHRMYTQDFIAAYTKYRVQSEHAVGINVDSPEWSVLYNYLAGFSPHILACDYSNFGPTLQFQCVKGAFEIINDWYDLHQNDGKVKQCSMARKAMAYEIGQAWENCLEALFQCHCGLPSGCTCTVYLNSLVNCLYIRYIFLDLIEADGLDYSIADFDKYVRLIVYGDDLLISVKPEILDWFNMITICKQFAKYEIKITDAGKTGKLYKSCDIHEVTFLKRRFVKFYPSVQDLPEYRKHPIILAPLEWDTICGTTNWTHRKEDEWEATIESAEASFVNAFGHGPIVYGSHCRKVHKACIMVSQGDMSPSYGDWYAAFRKAYPRKECPRIFGH